MKEIFRKIKPLLSVILIVGIFGSFLAWYGFESYASVQDQEISQIESEYEFQREIAKKIEERRKEKEAAKAAAKKAKKETEEEPATSSWTPSTETEEETPAPAPKPKTNLLFFYDPNCGACQIMLPIMHEINNEGSAPVVFFDVDKYPKYISKYGITQVPTYIVNGHKKAAVWTKAQVINYYNTYK
jgi:thiol-disulfide isomerase/thioredoxin